MKGCAGRGESLGAGDEWVRTADGRGKGRERQGQSGAGLTARQAEVLRVLREHVRLHGCAPTMREMMETLQVRSTCTVARMLETLRRKGFLKQTRAYAYRSYWPADLPTYAELLAELEVLRSGARVGELSDRSEGEANIRGSRNQGG